MTRCLQLAILLAVMIMVTTSANLNTAEGNFAEKGLRSLITKRSNGYSGASKISKKELALIERILRELEDDEITTTPAPATTTPGVEATTGVDTTPSSEENDEEEDSSETSTVSTSQEESEESMEWPDNNPVFHGLLSTIMDEYGADISKEDFLLFMAEATCILSDMIGTERTEGGAQSSPTGNASPSSSGIQKGRWFRGRLAGNPLRNAKSLETRFLEAFCDAVARDMDAGMKTLVEALEKFASLKDNAP